MLPLVQKRFSGELGQRIGEAVTEIQSRGMAALAEIMKGLPRDVGLLDRERLDGDPGAAEKHLTLAVGLRLGLTFKHNGEFQVAAGADQTAVGVVNDL